MLFTCSVAPIVWALLYTATTKPPACATMPLTPALNGHYRCLDVLAPLQC